MRGRNRASVWVLVYRLFILSLKKYIPRMDLAGSPSCPGVLAAGRSAGDLAEESSHLLWVVKSLPSSQCLASTGVDRGRKKEKGAWTTQHAVLGLPDQGRTVCREGRPPDVCLRGPHFFSILSVKFSLSAEIQTGEGKSSPLPSLCRYTDASTLCV